MHATAVTCTMGIKELIYAGSGVYAVAFSLNEQYAIH